MAQQVLIAIQHVHGGNAACLESKFNRRGSGMKIKVKILIEHETLARYEFLKAIYPIPWRRGIPRRRGKIPIFQRISGAKLFRYIIECLPLREYWLGKAAGTRQLGQTNKFLAIRIEEWNCFFPCDDTRAEIKIISMIKILTAIKLNAIEKRKKKFILWRDWPLIKEINKNTRGMYNYRLACWNNLHLANIWLTYFVRCFHTVLIRYTQFWNIDDTRCYARYMARI